MKFKTIENIVELCIIIVAISIGGVAGYGMGEKGAFEKIILEECWLSENQDIECVVHIAK